jgi:hypothetical protein
MKRTALIGFVAVVMVGVGFLVRADDKKAPNIAPTTSKVMSKEASGVDVAKTAADLAAWGRANKNPAALALASKMLAGVPMSELKAEMKSGPAEPSNAEKKDPKAVTADSLLAEAKALAGDNKDQLAAIDSIAKSGVAARGAIGGARQYVGSLDAQHWVEFTIPFRAGELAQAAIVGDGDTDLDLIVLDEYRNVICADTDNTDRCLAQWIPLVTGNFIIRVENHGSVYNRCFVLTN